MSFYRIDILMSKETLFDIIKYGEHRPVTYRKMIDGYLDTKFHGYYSSDWEDVENDRNYDHMYKVTHFIRIDVYFDKRMETTMVILSILDHDISQCIVDNDFDVSIQVQIETDNYSDKFVELFDEFYSDMRMACLSIEDRLENSDE